MDFLKESNKTLRDLVIRLGESDWCTLSENGDNVVFVVNAPPEIIAAPEMSAMRQAIDARSMLDIATILAVSKLMANGPKIFYPTLEQCESFEEVELRMDISLFTMPFPAIQIYFPKEYCTALDYKGLNGVLVYKQDPVVIVAGTGISTDGDIIRVIGPRCGPTLEAAIHYNGKADEGLTEHEEKMATRMMRLALNLCLFLSQSPHLLKPTDRRLIRELESPNRDTRRLATRKLAKAEQEIKLTQEIIVRETSNPARPNDIEGHHASPNPYWRKGYWHPYRTKTGHISHLRKPMYVNAWKFLGKLSETTVNMKGKA